MKLTYQELIIEVQQITANLDKHFYLMLLVVLLLIVVVILCANTMTKQNALRGKLDLQTQAMEHGDRIIQDIKSTIDRNTDAINRLLVYLEKRN